MLALILIPLFLDQKASDYTIYPFASTNSVDFNNLRNVYMDATFFPNLRELDFKQEGWRLEHEDPNGTSTYRTCWYFLNLVFTKTA